MSMSGTQPLRERARRSAAQGRFDEAERVYGEIAAAAPADLEALGFLSMQAMGKSQFDKAAELLERCRRVEPANAAILENLGICREALGQIDAAREALQAALEQDPKLHVARLYLGATLESMGREREALVAYIRAVAAAQKAGLWHSRQTTPAWQLAKVTHAIAFAQRGHRALVDDALAPLRERYGDVLARVEQCLAMQLGEVPLQLADARQRPKVSFLPGIPSTPFLDPALFPWLAELQAATPMIRAELEALLASEATFRPFLDFKAPGQLQQYLRGDGATPPAWDAFFFYRHGERDAENCQRCPGTAALLETLPLIRIRDHAPEICFSLLTPGTHILPHHGDTNSRVVIHLPLIVPADCALRVGGEIHAWREGQCVAFDDTFEHEAWNRSQDIRVVLILDAWNPHLSEAERAAFAEIVPRLGDLSREVNETP